MTTQTKPVQKVASFVSLRIEAFAVLAGLLALAFVPVVGTSYYVSVYAEILIFAIFALSLGFLMGFPHLISLGHAAFFGGGAYAAGIIVVHAGQANLLFTLTAALVLASLLALVIGALALRNVGIYFLMLTLALAQLVYVVAVQWEAVTGGTDGLVGIPYPEFFAFDFDRTTFYYLVLVLAGAAYFLLRAVTRSPFGHILLGIGSNESRMRAIGYDTRIYKLAAFVLAGAIAGVAGALWAHHQGLVSPGEVHWTLSAMALIMVIVGGAGTLIGPMLGAALVWYLEYGLRTYTDRSTMITGIVFILFVFFARRGVVGIIQDVWRRVRR